MNGTMMQYFHWYYGSTPAETCLWKKVQDDASYLATLGITALWLPPAFKGTSDKDVGYGIYDLYDLGEFNQNGTIATKYGTKEQYLQAINKAQSLGIQVYADLVFNHKASADATEWVKVIEMDANNRNNPLGREFWIEAWTKFEFAGRNGMYSNFKWNYTHFQGVDWAHNLDKKGIFKFLSKNWSDLVSKSNGNYDYLMYSDIDMDSPEVRTELAKWAKWFITTTNIDGFRLDAVKHIQYSFFRDWLAFLRKEFPQKKLFAVGEFWDKNLSELQNYIEKTQGCLSLFDVPLQDKFYQASRAQFGSFDMRTILDGTLVKDKPFLAVTIVDNHDTQPFQALEHWVDWWFKPLAYAIILLREGGYPTVFYPDLHGANYNECKDGKNYNINLAPVSKLDKLILARKHYAYGQQFDYFDDYHVIGWTRQGDVNHANSGIAVLLSNYLASTKWMYVGIEHANKLFYDYLDNCSGTVQINANGWGEFRVSAGSVSAWIAKI